MYFQWLSPNFPLLSNSGGVQSSVFSPSIGEFDDNFVTENDINSILQSGDYPIWNSKKQPVKMERFRDGYIAEKTDDKSTFDKTNVMETKSWVRNLPKLNMHFDPLINLKVKQSFGLMGTCVTLGLDYLMDISQWRTYCAVEDTLVRGRFSLRGSELGWAKSWLINLGMGEENSAKFKLRFGLNMKNLQAYVKLRFRTEPITPFDIGDGISCAGRLPIPRLLPILHNVPLRVEYRLRINASKPAPFVEFSRSSQQDKKVYLSTGIGTVDVTVEELNFCMEWDQHSPLWGIGIVKSEPMRKVSSRKIKTSSYE